MIDIDLNGMLTLLCFLPFPSTWFTCCTLNWLAMSEPAADRDSSLPRSSFLESNQDKKNIYTKIYIYYL